MYNEIKDALSENNFVSVHMTDGQKASIDRAECNHDGTVIRCHERNGNRAFAINVSQITFVEVSSRV